MVKNGFKVLEKEAASMLEDQLQACMPECTGQSKFKHGYQPLLIHINSSFQLVQSSLD